MIEDNLSSWSRSLDRSEEHTSELQSRPHLVCRLLLEKKNDRLPRVMSLLLTTPADGRTVLRRDLFGLETLVGAHLQREDLFPVPLLDEPVLLGALVGS